VERVAEAAGLARVRLSVAVVGDEEMGRLHERYLGDPETTDVLTFDLSPGTGRGAGGDGAGIDPGGGWRGGRVEGEVVVCMDEARRQASRRGHAVREECLLYVVHGLLHLMGYEDDTRTAFRKMHRRENELLTAAGYGALFGRVS
jgi:probable rRNA maturation factor